MLSDGGLMITVNGLLADTDPLSVTFTVKFNVLAAPGVPDITPPALKFTPPGKLPDSIDHA
jgi:hypothetical protein